MDLISVIIPTYNRADWLCDALETLSRQNTKGFEYEVIVVDNRSTDDTQSVVETLALSYPVKLTYVYEPNEGVAPARNHGIREASGDYLAFMDDDELAEPGWLLGLYDAIKSKQAVCAGGAVHLDMTDAEANKLGDRRRRALRERREDGGAVREMGPREYPGTDNLIVARHLLDSVGVFDESMRCGGSDNDLTIRIRKANNRLWFAPNAIVRHRVGPERLTAQFFKRDAMQSGSLLAFFDHKYGGLKKLLVNWIARTGQCLLVTTPKLLAGTLLSQNMVAENRIPFFRYVAYSRRALSLVAPKLFPEESFQQWLNFRKGRQLHKTPQDTAEVTA